MPKVIALILVIAGGALIWHGLQVRGSLKGKAQDAVSDVQKNVTGNPSVTDATWFMVGGGVLAVAGVALAAKGGKG